MTHPTASAIFSFLQHLFPDGEILVLSYQRTVLDPNQKIVDSKAELDPLQLTAEEPPLKTFAFLLNGEKKQVRSKSPLLSFVIGELTQLTEGGEFVVEYSGNRISENATLDPSAMYEVALIAEQLTVELHPDGAGARFTRFAPAARQKDFLLKDVLKTLGLARVSGIRLFG
jgi:hypothetical protein